MKIPPFLDLKPAAPEQADVLLLPLPFEATVSYGKGTASGPDAIWRASAQVELWDEELDFDLETLRFYSDSPVRQTGDQDAKAYLERVQDRARKLHAHKGLVVGVGGEHSLTPPLVKAAREARPQAAAPLTVVQIDAHADLRNLYEGSRHSHACAMRRVIEQGASLVAIGIRSADRDEAAYGRQCHDLQTFGAQGLALDPGMESRLMDVLGTLAGDVYLTVDIDGLDVQYCPGTGTPQPGGLGWWQTLRYLRRLLLENPAANLIGVDLCEAAPMAGTNVNEFCAARLLAKILTYRFARPKSAA